MFYDCDMDCSGSVSVQDFAIIIERISDVKGQCI